MSNGILDPADLFHTGVMVPDVHAAKQRLTAIAGYTWTPTFERTVAIWLDGRTRTVEFVFSYSLESPHIELVQNVPGTTWATGPGAATHLGYFVDDLPAVSRELTDGGFVLEACGLSGDGDEPAMFAYHCDADGVRIELVDRRRLGDWNGFIAQYRDLSAVDSRCQR